MMPDVDIGLQTHSSRSVPFTAPFAGLPVVSTSLQVQLVFT